LDQQDKSLLALQIANDAIATALASREKLSEPLEQEHAKRANPVNTPLLLEKKKIIQDKRAITDAKIKQASKITSAEIQSKKTILDKQKEQRDAKVKQLSSIKSPELRAKKDLISKKNVDNCLLAIQIANDAIFNALASREKLSLASREKLSELKEQEHAKRANPVNTSFSSEPNTEAPAANLDERKADSIQELQDATAFIKMAQKMAESSQNIDICKNDSVNLALSAAHDSLQNLTNVLIETQKTEVENNTYANSEADLNASDSANAAILYAEKSLNELTNAIISAEQNQSEQYENINTLEKSKVKQKAGQSQKESDTKFQQKAKTSSQKKKKIMPKTKQSIIGRFAPPGFRLKNKNMNQIKEKNKGKNNTNQDTEYEKTEQMTDYEAKNTRTLLSQQKKVS
jgi:hypothetical protein